MKMSKELLITFLYDTKRQLNEEDDPHEAVVYFYPSWVSANQRMALCGQLMGVTQFLDTNFSFPKVIALRSGKFSVKKLGPYMLCVGTDRNIPDWVLQRRIDMLYQILTFFHLDLNMDHYVLKTGTLTEKLAHMFEMYLPVLHYASNIFGNTPTIRLPKSASSIFLEAAQILECLQEQDGIHGGAVLYQNKVVMSQLSTNMTKQLIITDPYRIKLPAERVQTSFHMPVGLQLLIVFVEEDELLQLEKERLPPTSFCKTLQPNKVNDDSFATSNGNIKKAPSCIFTVVEEEVENDTSPLKLHDMPDIVKDTVKLPIKISKLRSDKNNLQNIDNVNLSTYVVDDCNKSNNPISRSTDNLANINVIPIRYYSLGMPRVTDEAYTAEVENLPQQTSSINNSEVKDSIDLNTYYNTISDPVFPWFKYNGLPASKALHDDRIMSYYKSIDEANRIISQEKLESKEEDAQITDIGKAAVRPTSIALSSNRVNRRKAQARQNLIFGLKTDEFTNDAVKNNDNSDDYQKLEANNVSLTPLMANLKLLEKEQATSSIITPAMTPVTGKFNLSSNIASMDTTTRISECAREEKSKKKFNVLKEPSKLKRLALYVFGQQNVSIFLLMDEEASKNADLIHTLWKICFNCISDLENHFKRCFESIPQTQFYDIPTDSYSYINIHSGWETLQKGGVWTHPQLDILTTLHDDFKFSNNITDITVRSEDSVIYGSQLGDSQVFYQQGVTSVAGLPMPSDLMGVVPLKAKRRLERDHGILLL